MFSFDRATFNIIETGEGFIKALVTFAVPGVFPYIEGDSIEYRAKLPEDILSPQTIQSAIGAPITDGHPKENGEYVLVTPDNYKLYAKGSLSNPVADGMEAKAIATILDPDLIQKIKEKKANSETVEVSIGFDQTLEQTPGIYNGAKYDAIQRNIRINHLAIVDYARAGERTKLYTDARKSNMSDNAGKAFTYRTFDGKKEIQVDSQEIFDELLLVNKENKALKDSLVGKVVVDAGEMEALKARAGSVDPRVPDEDGAKEKEALLQEVAAKEQELEALEAKIAAMEEKYKTEEDAMPKKIEDAANERVNLIDTAKSVDCNTKFDGLSNREIKLQVIARGLPFKEGVQVDSMPDELVNSRYEGAVEILKIKANRPQGVIGQQISNDSLQVDEQTIMKKREALLNVYENERSKK
jgi:hypothetical protein